MTNIYIFYERKLSLARIHFPRKPLLNSVTKMQREDWKVIERKIIFDLVTISDLSTFHGRENQEIDMHIHHQTDSGSSAWRKRQNMHWEVGG